jgi:hypothetical protein
LNLTDVFNINFKLLILMLTLNIFTWDNFLQVVKWLRLTWQSQWWLGCKNYKNRWNEDSIESTHVSFLVVRTSIALAELLTRVFQAFPFQWIYDFFLWKKVSYSIIVLHKIMDNWSTESTNKKLCVYVYVVIRNTWNHRESIIWKTNCGNSDQHPDTATNCGGRIRILSRNFEKWRIFVK